MSGGGSRVSIPSSMKKMIANIKEITGNHSEEDIYAMLKECSMDPNETAQRLLLQDTFHVVKRKRDKRKENVNREPPESRWRPGLQGRGSRGGRANFSSHYPSRDGGGGKKFDSGRNSGTSQPADKGIGPTLPTSQEAKHKETAPAASSVSAMANGPCLVASEGTGVLYSSDLLGGTGTNQPEVFSSAASINKLGRSPSPVDTNKTSTIAFGSGSTQGEPAPSSSSLSSSTVCFLSSDPVLVSSNDLWLPGAVGTIKREVGSHRTSDEPKTAAENKLSAVPSEIGSSFMQGKVPSKSHGIMKNQLTESSQPMPISIHSSSSVSRPPSNYNNRSQEIISPQKVGSNKEWKPKPTNPSTTQGPGTAASSEVTSVLVEASAQPQSVSSVLDLEETTSKLQKKLGELHLPQRQHVIIPTHIHVPESERTKLSFGSFDASFAVTTNYVGALESEKSSTAVSEASQVVEETVEEEAASNENRLATAEVGDYPDHSQSPNHVRENLSGDSDVSNSAVPEYNEAKQETTLLSGGQQYSVVHTNPNYSFGFGPPMLGSQFAPFENSESQAREVSRLPSFVVQQPFDPASYYAQFYLSGADSDSRVSPFPSAGVAAKYNGNVSVLPPQTTQSPQESGNSLVLSAPGPTPLATQAAGLMQSSIAVTQQPVPVFRPPTGVHVSYPPNYIPYGHYFSPFYVQPPTIHQFLNNGAFPQQSQTGSIYPAPQAAATTGAKFSLLQYKPGTNTGNSNHIGMPSGYGPYGSSPAGYNPSSAATAGNSTPNEELGASQFKDNNVYITGQQSEGSAMWIAAPGREISSLPGSSFYNLPQGQHVTFASTQAGHGTFAGIYRPAQTVTAATVHPLLQQSQTMARAVEMGGPAASVYQQPQHAQINWPSSY